MSAEPPPLAQASSAPHILPLPTSFLVDLPDIRKPMLYLKSRHSDLETRDREETERRETERRETCTNTRKRGTACETHKRQRRSSVAETGRDRQHGSLRRRQATRQSQASSPRTATLDTSHLSPHLTDTHTSSTLPPQPHRRSREREPARERGGSREAREAGSSREAVEAGSAGAVTHKCILNRRHTWMLKRRASAAASAKRRVW